MGVIGFELRASHILRELVRPDDLLERINATDDIAINHDETEDLCDIETDICVDPQQVGIFLVSKELSNNRVARSGDQAVTTSNDVAELEPLSLCLAVEAKHAHKVVLENCSAIAGRCNNHVQVLNVVWRKHCYLRMDMCSLRQTKQ